MELNQSAGNRSHLADKFSNYIIYKHHLGHGYPVPAVVATLLSLALSSLSLTLAGYKAPSGGAF